jgi:hypothetical protein
METREPESPNQAQFNGPSDYGYAKRQAEHEEIARLHGAIRAIEADLLTQARETPAPPTDRSGAAPVRPASPEGEQP